MGKGARNRNARAEIPRPKWNPTKAQKDAMIAEINRQILIRDEEYWLNFDACILWTIHTSLGFGEKRLKKIFLDFNREHNRMREYYQLNDAEGNGYVARELLRQSGIDLEAWEKEVGLR